MSKTKKPQIDRNVIARQEAKQHHIENMPVNKDFLHAKNEDGTPKYPIVDKLWKYKMLDVERIYDYMRQCSAFVAQVRHHRDRAKRLSEELKSESIEERNEYGRVLTKEEVQAEIINSKLAIPREITRIRECLVDKMLPLIDGIKLTGELYNDYVCLVKKSVEDLGYELFPDKLEIIFPEL
jgi:hypothetical protein